MCRRRCVAHAADRLGDVDVVRDVVVSSKFIDVCMLGLHSCVTGNWGGDRYDYPVGSVWDATYTTTRRRPFDDGSHGSAPLQIVRAARYIRRIPLACSITKGTHDTHGLQGSVEVCCAPYLGPRSVRSVFIVEECMP